MRLFKLLRILKMQVPGRGQGPTAAEGEEKLKKKKKKEGGIMARLEKMPNQVKNFILFFINYMFFNHLFACLWFFQAKIQGFPDSCWVARDDVREEAPGYQYLISFYWAYQTTSTVGFGSPNANGGNLVEMLIACFWIILGVMFSSQLLGSLIQIIETADRDNQVI